MNNLDSAYLKSLSVSELGQLKQRIDNEIDERTDNWTWQELAEHGLTIKAIVVLHREYLGNKERPKLSDLRKRVVEYVESL